MGKVKDAFYWVLEGIMEIGIIGLVLLSIVVTILLRTIAWPLARLWNKNYRILEPYSSRSHYDKILDDQLMLSYTPEEHRRRGHNI